MEDVSTAGLPSWRKASFLGDLAAEQFSSMEIKALDLVRLDGTLRLVSAGPVDLASVYCAAAHVRHRWLPGAGAVQPGYRLTAPFQGQYELSVGPAKAITVGMGDICLLDLAHSYEARNTDGVRLLSVDIPRSTLEHRAAGIRRLTGQLLARNTVAFRTLLGLLHTLGRELAAGYTRALPHEVGTSLLSLVAEVVQSRMDSGNSRGVRAAGQDCLGYIDQRLTEPDLTPATVARHFGISERYLRMVLQAEGESFSAYLLRRRLMRCAEKLRDQRYAATTIMDIALAAGFNSPTHFADAFKVRYGLTPREYRRGSDPGPLRDLAVATA